MTRRFLDAGNLFPTADHQRFPVCTQVTLLHGLCDSRCLSCPVGRVNFGDASPDLHRELGPQTRATMPFDLFCRVADEVATYPFAWLRLHARGEPLLHPDFVDMIAYAKRAGVRLVQAFTDAIRLSESMARHILAAGLDVLECSIHGHDLTYERLMRNGKQSQARENVIRFHRLRNACGAETRLVVSAVDQPGFQEDKAAHQAFWLHYADQVIYRPYHSWGNRIEPSCGAVPASRHPCSQLWNRCTIGPTGNVLACFNSWAENSREVLGNLYDEGTSIADVWQSDRFKDIRQCHLDGEYSLPCCRDCSDWTGSAWGPNSYEHLLNQKLGLGGEA